MTGAVDTGARITRKFPFAQVPEWIIYHPDLSDRAVRLWSVLARHGTDAGARCPGRTRLAELCGGCSVDSIDRAKAELVAVGALKVEHQFLVVGAHLPNKQRTNHYHLIDSPPVDNSSGSRRAAATSSRTGAAGVAAPVRHNREVSTDRTAAEQIVEASTARMRSNGQRIEEEPPADARVNLDGIRAARRAVS